MMPGYTHLAVLYDQLMEDAPYDQWVKWIADNIRDYRPGSKEVADVGCGTGTIAIALAEKDYQLTGVDLSADMLTMAVDKSLQHKVKIDWVEQDMTKLDLGRTYDVITCLCDALNYITDEQALKKAFMCMNNHLNPDGLLLFDCHTPYKLEHIYGDNTFVQMDEDLSYIWQCAYEERAIIVEHDLSVFVRSDQGKEHSPYFATKEATLPYDEQENKVYRRYDECHQQRAYQVDDMLEWVIQSGFEIKDISSDFGPETPHEKTERLFVVASKSTNKS